MCIDVYFDAEQQERTGEPPFKQKCVLTTVTKEAGNQFFFLLNSTLWECLYSVTKKVHPVLMIA